MPMNGSACARMFRAASRTLFLPMKRPSPRPHRWLSLFQRALTLCALVGVVSLFLAVEGCSIYQSGAATPASLSGYRRRVVTMEVTGYDSGPRSCNWTRNWRGQPVIASGPNKGKPKAVGITASGKKARHGTVAADTDYYPFGTILYIPGYGYGRVEDRGGAIKGPNRLDLWFPTEREALQWGRKKNVTVTVWTK